MKISKTTIYIKYPNCIYGFKLNNRWSQCYFDIYTGERIQIKREIVTLENKTSNETEQNINTY